MAVCNLFNDLTNPSGNFLMFSQYVESITKNITSGDTEYKVIPSKFIALNIDYTKLNMDKLIGNSTLLNDPIKSLNTLVPKYFQNYFENGCAYGRGLEIDDFDWTPEKSKNLFWNSMWDAEFLHSTPKDDVNIIDEIMYYGNINMYSYNEHKGMGYGEIYCYIPTDAGKINCQVVTIESDSQVENPSSNLEGLDINNPLSKTYCYENKYTMSFDSDELANIYLRPIDKYNVNTFILLYDVNVKINDNWTVTHSGIPMGMYFTGNFEENGNLTNSITKFVSTSYGNGTSYGLRICTRFSVSPNGMIINTSDVSVDENYVNYCQLMTGMNENLSRMLDIVKSSHDTTNQYKNLLSMVKNNRTNVPYVKTINGDDCWFVNGRFVSKVGVDPTGCLELTYDEINDYLNGIPVDSCTCTEATSEELAEKLLDYGIDITDSPENPDTPGTPTNNDFEIATPGDIESNLNITQ